jgi:CheY-like chemotaxis protein
MDADLALRVGTSQPPSILVVEDYDDSREMYAEMFTLAGHRVITARDGQEGLDRALAEQFDLIIMDMALPKVDGITVIKTLRSRPDTKNTPIIALSATVGELVGKAALEAGADRYCAKPCPTDELVSEVSKLLARRVGS